MKRIIIPALAFVLASVAALASVNMKRAPVWRAQVLTTTPCVAIDVNCDNTSANNCKVKISGQDYEIYASRSVGLMCQSVLKHSQPGGFITPNP
ncbi:MAG TPA: DUF6520 family protein [Chryseolinea sp.]|nr:DUF6520 family protein [Chryseolinea sp.]